MEQVLASCGPWIEATAVITGKNIPACVGIVLQSDSFSYAFFVIRIEGRAVALFPIDNYLRSYIDSFQVSLEFIRYDLYLDLLFKNISDALSVHSHINLLAKISLHFSDSFDRENSEFLAEFRSTLESHPSTTISVPPLYPLSAEASKGTWMRGCLSQNRGYYTKLAPIEFSFVTWNVAQIPPNNSTPTVASFAFSSKTPIVAICLQEIDYSIQAVVIGTSPVFQTWDSIFSSIAESSGYTRVSSSSLGGVYLGFFVSSTLRAPFSVASTKSIRFGINGLAANKSAIICVLDVGLTKIAVVGCHLDPHNEAYEERNKQMRQLFKELAPLDAHYNVILGDLNYRVDLAYEDAVERCERNDIETLLQNDQLHRIRKEDPEFDTFKERDVTFKPTYRFDLGCDIYDTSEKRRVPSWTDRVLFKEKTCFESIGNSEKIRIDTDIIKHLQFNIPFHTQSCFDLEKPEMNYPTPIEVMSYNSFAVRVSDHRPVCAVLKIDIALVDDKRKVQLKALLAKKEDEITEIGIPRCKAEPNSFEMKDSTLINLANVSCSVCHWNIDPIPACISADVMSGMLVPGTSVAITLKKIGPIDGVQVGVINVNDGSPSAFEFWEGKRI